MERQEINKFILFTGLCNILYTWSAAEEIQNIATTSSIHDVINGQKGYKQFLHVSDFHVDPHYATQKSCSKKNLNGTKQYGRYECDSPKILVKSAISYMKKRFPNPDFILWTGAFKLVNLFWCDFG